MELWSRFQFSLLLCPGACWSWSLPACTLMSWPWLNLPEGSKWGGSGPRPGMPWRAEKDGLRHFRQLGQILLLPIHLLFQMVPPVLLFPQPYCQ